MTTVGDIIEELEDIAPPELADEGDPIGLQVGSRSKQARRVCVSVDTSASVVDAAIAAKADLLVAHHPLIYAPLTSMDESDPVAQRVAKLITAKTALYVMHTNYDTAPGGVNDVLARVLDVVDCRPLTNRRQDRFHKVCVFVPEEAVDRVMSAMADAGAGRIGQYTHCSFRTPGTGTFVPLPAAQPYVGTTGKLEEASEYRLEMLCAASWLENVTAAMIEEHPYDEVAYDIYELANEPVVYGYGRVGSLHEEATLAQLADRVKSALDLEHVKVAGDADRAVRTVALCSGGGSSLFREAAASGADVYITGDTKHHDILDANALGLAIIDAGHFETERPGMAELTERLATTFAGSGVQTEFVQ